MSFLQTIFKPFSNKNQTKTTERTDRVPLSSEERAEIEEKTLKGMDCAEIARDLGRTRAVVWQYLQRTQQKTNAVETSKEALAVKRLDLERIKLDREMELENLKIEREKLSLNNEIAEMKSEGGSENDMLDNVVIQAIQSRLLTPISKPQQPPAVFQPTLSTGEVVEPVMPFADEMDAILADIKAGTIPESEVINYLISKKVPETLANTIIQKLKEVS